MTVHDLRIFFPLLQLTRVRTSVTHPFCEMLQLAHYVRTLHVCARSVARSRDIQTEFLIIILEKQVGDFPIPPLRCVRSNISHAPERTIIRKKRSHRGYTNRGFPETFLLTIPTRFEAVWGIPLRALETVTSPATATDGKNGSITCVWSEK